MNPLYFIEFKSLIKQGIHPEDAQTLAFDQAKEKILN